MHTAQTRMTCLCVPHMYYPRCVDPITHTHHGRHESVGREAGRQTDEQPDGRATGWGVCSQSATPERQTDTGGGENEKKGVGRSVDRAASQ
mmetsp:Transcript_26345/g.65518  ORF Transcript_26345/g.65518 Transcript_26345/m.65518 type:complete len:91 (+) Transcript_26345:902-1174(+)